MSAHGVLARLAAATTAVLLAGCIIGGDRAFAVQIQSDSSESHVVVVQSGLSRWGYQIPAHTTGQIQAQSWAPDTNLELRTGDCQSESVYPVSTAGIYLITVTASNHASSRVADRGFSPEGVILEQSEVCAAP